MQGIGRDIQRQLARWIATVIVAAPAAISGQQHWPSSGPGRSNDPVPDQVAGHRGITASVSEGLPHAHH